MAKIMLTEGLLSIDLETEEPIIIPEQPMSAYEQFFIFYTAAISVLTDEANQNESFVQLYVNNPTFRKNMLSALQAVGVERPERLPPTALKQLLLARPGDDGKMLPGYLFSLHNEVAPSPKAKPAKMSRRKLSPVSILRGWWQSISLKTLAFWTGGLCAAF